MLVTTRLKITEFTKTFSLQGPPTGKFKLFKKNLCAHMCNPAQNACWYGAGGMSTAGMGDRGAYFLTGF